MAHGYGKTIFEKLNSTVHCRLLALSDVSQPCDGMSPNGATTDIGQDRAVDASVENDPKRTLDTYPRNLPALWYQAVDGHQPDARISERGADAF